VLDGGRPVQHGGYAELAAADGPFRRMLERERAVDAVHGPGAATVPAGREDMAEAARG
jgi:ATP-binding cassette subfamily C protein CydCD